MNVREAILKAAALIERKPEAWDFFGNYVPKNDCGSPACAIGWIAHYRNVGIERLSHHICVDALGVDHRTFYDRMGELNESVDEPVWMMHDTDTRVVASVLRRYADKYHPAEQPKREGIPAAVRAIFEPAKEVA